MLALGIARLPWSELGLRALYVEVTVMAVAFAAIGFYQYDTRNIFQNPKLGNSNAYAPYFRVNSVFWDPSVYGRFLVIAMAPSIVLIVLGRSLKWSLTAVAVLVVTWLGLLISFSQSSFAALLVVAIGAAFIAWRWRALVAVALAFAVLAGIAVAQPQIRRSLQHHTSSGLNSASSGRASLVANGIRIAKAHPVRGVGVGGFKRAYADRVGLRGKDPKKAASHDTPVTVAAETGIPGLALFTWLLVALGRQAFRRAGRVGLVAGLGLAAIFGHSLFYNAFFEDPLTWMLIGLVALASPLLVPMPRVERAAVEPKEAVPV
jgi:O-antigen ligase